MDHRVDRLTSIKGQLDRFPELFSGAVRHRGRKPHEVLDEGLATIEQVGVMMRRTEGAVACHFGQVEIMREALKQGKSSVVLEDDCIMCDDLPKRIEYIENWVNTKEPSFDVIWLGASFHCNPPYWHRKGGSMDMRSNCSAELGYDAKLTDDARMVRTYAAFATFAYIVNKNSIPKIFDLFDVNIHKSIGIDWLFCLLQPQLKCFSFVPGCVKQMDNQSDIGNGITRWSGFLQLNGTPENSAYVFQERMEDFDPTKFDWHECI